MSDDPAAAKPNGRPSAAERLRNPEARLTRTDLRELGWERRAIDVIFANCPIVSLPGYSRPTIAVDDYQRFLEENTYDDRAGDRVRPA
jgi:hypothetical protein